MPEAEDYVIWPMSLEGQIMTLPNLVENCINIQCKVKSYNAHLLFKIYPSLLNASKIFK